MIVLYIGRRGSGKTTTLVKDAYKFKLEGWEIITNMDSISFSDLVLPNDEILKLLETEKRNFVIVIDEIQTFIDSRRSARKQNVGFTYFIQQVRKRNVIILATTQFARRVDKAFREHIDILAMPRYLEEFPVIVCTYSDLTAIEGFIDGSDRLAETEIVFNPIPIFDLFDTTEVIKPIKTNKK